MTRAYVVQTRSGQIVSAHEARTEQAAMDLAKAACRCNPLPGREAMTSTRWEKEFNWMRCN